MKSVQQKCKLNFKKTPFSTYQLAKSNALMVASANKMSKWVFRKLLMVEVRIAIALWKSTWQLSDINNSSAVDNKPRSPILGTLPYRNKGSRYSTVLLYCF